MAVNFNIKLTARLKKGVMTSLFVGSMLTLINQYQAIFGMAELNLITMALTYVVPFCVHWNSTRAS